MHRFLLDIIDHVRIVSAFKVNNFAQDRRSKRFLFTGASFIIARAFDNEIRYTSPFPSNKN